MITTNIDEFAKKIEHIPDMNTSALKEIFADGPEIKIESEKNHAGDEQDFQIENGIAFQLRIPHRNPALVDLRLNGQLQVESPTDGYVTARIQQRLRRNQQARYYHWKCRNLRPPKNLARRRF